MAVLFVFQETLKSNKTDKKSYKISVKKYFLIFFVCLSFSFILFGNGIRGDYIYDDNVVITGNPLVFEPKITSLRELILSPYNFKQPESGLYRPLTVTTYMLNWLIFGGSPISFHVLNIILHALVVFLIYVVVNKIICNERIATLTSAIFLLMPIHSEAVTSIVGRAELLASLFVCLALLSALKEKLWHSSIFLFLGLLSKETAVSFIPIWFYISTCIENKSFTAEFRKIKFFLPAIMLYISLRYIVLHEYFISNSASTIYNPIKYAGIFSGFWTSLKVMYLYIQKMVFPKSFSSDYSFNQVPVVNNLLYSWEAISGLIILLLLCYLLFLKNKKLQLASVFFLAPFFVISNFIFKIGTIMAERLIYLPSLGIALLLAIFLNFLAGKRRLKILTYVFILIIAIFYSVKLIERNRAWLSRTFLYQSAFSVAPGSVVNINNVASLALDNNDLETAQKQIDKALVLASDFPPTLNLAGKIYELKGDYNNAEKFFLKSLEVKPNSILVIRNLGELYFRMNRLNEAEAWFAKAIEFYPSHNDVFLMSITKIKLKKYDEAIGLINKNFGENPDDKNLIFSLGLAYYRLENEQKAWIYFNKIRDKSVKDEVFLKELEKI